MQWNTIIKEPLFKYLLEWMEFYWTGFDWMKIIEWTFSKKKRMLRSSEDCIDDWLHFNVLSQIYSTLCTFNNRHCRLKHCISWSIQIISILHHLKTGWLFSASKTKNHTGLLDNKFAVNGTDWELTRREKSTGLKSLSLLSSSCDAYRQSKARIYEQTELRGSGFSGWLAASIRMRQKP